MENVRIITEERYINGVMCEISYVNPKTKHMSMCEIAREIINIQNGRETKERKGY